MVYPVLPGFLALQSWARPAAGLILALLVWLPAGCDTGGPPAGSIVKTAPADSPKTSLENDAVAKQELARIEYKLRDLNTITQKDCMVLEGLRKDYPDNERILKCLLPIYNHLNDWNAMADLLKSFPGIEQNPKQADACGAALIKTGRFEEAKAVFAHLNRTQPHQDSVSLAYAQCLFHTGEMEQAAGELDKLVEVAGGDYLYKAFSLRGLVAIQQQDLVKAKGAFLKTLELAPDDPTAILSMARILLNEGDTESAAKYELRAQALRNQFNRQKNAEIIDGTVTEAIRRAIRQQDFAEARKLIGRQMPQADPAQKQELESYLYMIQEAESLRSSGPARETGGTEKLP